MSGLDDLAGSMGPEDYGSLNEKRFEAKVVDEIIKHFGMSKARRELYDMAEAATGSRVLTFDTFFERYPDFPIYLRPTYIPKVQKVMDTWVLVNHFDKAPAVEAWKDLYYAAGDGLPCPVGVVYNWPQHVRFLVLHNAALDTQVPGFRPGIWAGPDADPLIIEPLKLLLDSIAKRWQPED